MMMTEVNSDEAEPATPVEIRAEAVYEEERRRVRGMDCAGSRGVRVRFWVMGIDPVVLSGRSQIGVA